MAQIITRKYQFSVDTAFSQIAAVIIEEQDAELARQQAYIVLQGLFGRHARVTTSAKDAKVVRKLSDKTEGMERCFSTNDDGSRKYWAWYVYAR